MKKYILSFLVITTFAFYAVYQRISGTANSLGTTNIVSNELTISTSTNVSQPPPPVKISQPPPPVKVISTGLYKDGQYTGISADAYYGYIQVQATISGGKLTGVQFLDYPHDRGTSISINTQAMPYLRSEAIQAQSANVRTISGATDSSGAFRQSLASALAQAKNS